MRETRLDQGDNRSTGNIFLWFPGNGHTLPNLEISEEIVQGCLTCSGPQWACSSVMSCHSTAWWTWSGLSDLEVSLAPLHWPTLGTGSVSLADSLSSVHRSGLKHLRMLQWLVVTTDWCWYIWKQSRQLQSRLLWCYLDMTNQHVAGDEGRGVVCAY